MKWRIIENTYYDNYGIEKDRYYYIEIRKRFLGVIPYWSCVTHKESYGSTLTTFKSHTDAYDFIHTKLAGIRRGWKSEPINVGTLVK